MSDFALRSRLFCDACGTNSPCENYCISGSFHTIASVRVFLSVFCIYYIQSLMKNQSKNHFYDEMGNILHLK